MVVGAIEPAQANNTLQLLEDVFKCNYEANSWGWKLLWFLRTSNYKDWVLHNDDLRAACDGKPSSLCYDPDFVSTSCEQHPIQLIKTVRVRTSEASQLLHNKGQTLSGECSQSDHDYCNCCRPQHQNYSAPQRPSRCEGRLN